MFDFSDFISSHGLIDLPLDGGYFTWSNTHEQVLRSRIDCILFLTDWEVQFTNVYHWRLPCLMFDHFPIILDYGSFQRSCHPFRFENMWLKAEGFVK